MNQDEKKISLSVIHRLPRYLVYLRKLVDREWVSSKEIARALGLTSSTVRQDLSHIEFFGISKKGYEVKKLEATLLDIFGVGRKIRLIIIGAGNIGKAIARYEGFAGYGMEVCHLFDNDPVVVGRNISGLIVEHTGRMEAILRDDPTDIAILAVPFQAAQQVADKLVAAGVKGILNFTATHIITDGKTRVIDNQIVTSLLELNCLI